MIGWNETPEEVAKRLKQYRAEFGDWLRRYAWSHWATLTVEKKWSLERLVRELNQRFVRYATRAAQGPVPYVYVIEGGALGDRPHAHVLLSGTERLDATRLQGAWPHGRARVEVYNPEQAAANYLTKEFGGKALDYGQSRRLPPLRLDDCQHRAGSTTDGFR